MNYSEDHVIAKGEVERIIDYLDGGKITTYHKNTVLISGRTALVKSLTNNIGDSFNYYINRIVFGNGGTLGGAPRLVNGGRTALFGSTVISKSAIASYDGPVAIFTSVLTFSDANGETINEMALKLNSADLYSMVTFADLTKTSSMQVTFNWRQVFL